MNQLPLPKLTITTVPLSGTASPQGRFSSLSDPFLNSKLHQSRMPATFFSAQEPLSPAPSYANTPIGRRSRTTSNSHNPIPINMILGNESMQSAPSTQIHTIVHHHHHHNHYHYYKCSSPLQTPQPSPQPINSTLQEFPATQHSQLNNGYRVATHASPYSNNGYPHTLPSIAESAPSSFFTTMAHQSPRPSHTERPHVNEPTPMIGLHQASLLLDAAKYSDLQFSSPSPTACDSSSSSTYGGDDAESDIDGDSDTVELCKLSESIISGVKRRIEATDISPSNTITKQARTTAHVFSDCQTPPPTPIMEGAFNPSKVDLDELAFEVSVRLNYLFETKP